MPPSPRPQPVRHRLLPGRSFALIATLTITVLVASAPVAYAQTVSGHRLTGAVLTKYQQVGAQRGTLGAPIADQRTLKGGVVANFAHGSIYWSKATGAHIVRGAIRDKWGSMGWETSYLGYPTADEKNVPGGAVSSFAGGSIYFSPSTGAHVVRDAIRAKWTGLGATASSLGFPTADQKSIAGGQVARFSGGSVYWSKATGAHVLSGAIRSFWGDMDAERSVLGYPTSDLYAVRGGLRQDFRHGSVVWTKADGAQLNELTVSGGRGTTTLPFRLGKKAMIVDVRNTDPSGKAFKASTTVGLSWADPIQPDFSSGKGTFSTTTTVGLDWTGLSSPRNTLALAVTSGGSWKLHFRPVSTAPVLTPGSSRSGSGEGLLHYVGGPTTLTVTHTPFVGKGWLAVDKWDTALWSVTVLGYRGSTPTSGTLQVDGETYLQVEGTLTWTFTAPAAS
jgi:LGFP repeat